jgi:NAD(P)-dependent dehydrogenase (short-subunit alcohol dehydrogenase family)
MKSLNGKVAVITGASKGIGEAIARIFAENGAKVVVSSRKLEDVEKVADELNNLGFEAFAVACNTGKESDRLFLIEHTIKKYGQIDILVNNAATNPVFGPSVDCESAAFDKIMEVNVKGPFELCKLAYPYLKQSGQAAVINISSVAGSTPDPGLGVYSVSKAALDMLTKVLAKEWGVDGIRVNAIAPGLIKTKFSEALWNNENNLRSFMKNQPIKRMGTSEEIAQMAIFLASGASSYTTGSILAADGGLLI